MKKVNWLEYEIAFYDFIWTYGVQAHSKCINKEIAEDFKNGGNKFEEMKSLIQKKWPLMDDAMDAFTKSKEYKLL